MEKQQSNGMAVAALVLGIVAIVFAFIFPYVGDAAGIVGIVLAVKARPHAVPGKTGMVTAGLVCSIVGLALSAVMTACVICAYCAVKETVNELNNLYYY